MIESLPRGALLRRAAVGGAAVALGGIGLAAIPQLAGSAPSAERDAQILGLGLLVEQLQAAFYGEAAARGKIAADLLGFARVAQAQEQEHVAAFQTLIGGGAAKAPAFEFGESTTDDTLFAHTSIRIENLAVGAFNGQVANLTLSTRAAAARVASVDARHAGWMRGLVGEEPAPQAVDAGLSAEDVAKAIVQTGLVPGFAP